MMRRAASVAVVVASTGWMVFAQTPDLSGTWRLNRDASTIDPAAGLASLARGGAPNTIYITAAANNTVAIGSDINESQSRLYRIGAESKIPMTQDAVATVTTRWNGGVLVAEGQQAARGSAPAMPLRETYALSADRKTLTVTVTITAPDGPHTSTMVFEALASPGPCSSWPTPCQPG